MNAPKDIAVPEEIYQRIQHGRSVQSLKCGIWSKGSLRLHFDDENYFNPSAIILFAMSHFIYEYSPIRCVGSVMV